MLLWLSDTSGVTGIEYGILAFGMGTAIVGGVFAYGEDMRAMLEEGLSPYLKTETELG